MLRDYSYADRARDLQEKLDALEAKEDKDDLDFEEQAWLKDQINFAWQDDEADEDYWRETIRSGEHTVEEVYG